MATPTYSWDIRARRYRNETTGRFVAEATVTVWRNAIRTAMEKEVTALAARLAAGTISIQQWEVAMRASVRTVSTVDFLLGVGGLKRWNAADKVELGKLIKAQYDYLRGMTEDIIKGEMTERAIAARARMYVRSANTAYNQAKARSWDLDLPGYPGIGTLCLSNCGCEWLISSRTKKGVTTVTAKWALGKEDNCATCLDRARKWRELTFVLD